MISVAKLASWDQQGPKDFLKRELGAMGFSTQKLPSFGWEGGAPLPPVAKIRLVREQNAPPTLNHHDRMLPWLDAEFTLCPPKLLYIYSEQALAQKLNYKVAHGVTKICLHKSF